MELRVVGGEQFVGKEVVDALHDVVCNHSDNLCLILKIINPNHIILIRHITLNKAKLNGNRRMEINKVLSSSNSMFANSLQNSLFSF